MFNIFFIIYVFLRSPLLRNRSITPRRRSHTRSRSPLRKRKKSLSPVKRLPLKSRRRTRSPSRDVSRRSRSLSLHRRYVKVNIHLVKY